MDAEDYVKNVLKTENVDFDAIRERFSDDRIIRLFHASMGLVTEAGEFMDQMKKYLIYGKALDEVNLCEEIGDSDWYKGIAVDTLMTRFETIWERNIAKLHARYGDKFNESSAISRDLEVERKILEGVTHYRIAGVSTGNRCGTEEGIFSFGISQVTCYRCLELENALVHYMITKPGEPKFVSSCGAPIKADSTNATFNTKGVNCIKCKGEMVRTHFDRMQ